MTVKLLLIKSENGLETRQDYDGLSSANPAFTGTLTGASAALTGDVDAGGEIKSGTLAGADARPLVTLADGTIDDQPPATFLGTIGALAASLKGAANGVAELGADVKIPVAQLPSAALLALGSDSTTAHRGDHGTAAYNHSQATGNPHGTTAADVGAMASTNPNFTGELQQGGAPRITAGGEGRFASLRGTDLANTDSSAVFADANGNLQKTPHLSLSLVNGPQFGVRVGLMSAVYNGTSGYLATSLRMGPDEVAESNNPLGIESGDFWNSKRYHAIGIADGAVGARYLGRIRADRWTGTSAVLISGTTSATSWFAAGTGEGSPSLPANYLKGGRRVRAKGRVSCQSCAADSAPEFAFKIGSTTIKTQAKAFTVASGNAIYIDFDVDFFADGDGFLVAVGDIKFYSPAVGGSYEYKISYVGAYDGSTAKTIDATIKPSSGGETWARNLAFVEA